MVWPTDTLTTTHLDASTDSAASARAELYAAVQMIQSILAEVTAGQTVWHSGNDGAASGLDADLLDGQHGSYYQNAANLTAGLLALARIPTTLTGKDADLLDGQHGSYYRDASNLNAGTVPNARLPSAGLTAEGIIELATDAEAKAGADNTRAITPFSLDEAIKDWFAKSGTATSGTMVLHEGIMINWGEVSSPDTGSAWDTSITFATAFPSACYVVLATGVAVSGLSNDTYGLTDISTKSKTTTGAVMRVHEWTAWAQNIKIGYLAIGI